MVSIQTVSIAKKSSIVAAILLSCILVAGCSNKEQSAYRLAAQAQQQLEAGDVASARLTIDKALRERDDLVELHLLKGQIELKGNSLEGAFVSFSNALSLDPVNQDALQSVAMLGLQTGHTDDAEDATLKLLAVSPRNPTGLIVKGLLALERRKYAEALEAADGILSGAPTDESAVILKTRALYLSGSPEEAKDLLDRTVRLVGSTRGYSRIALEIARVDGNVPAMLQAFANLRKNGGLDGPLTFDEANTHYKSGDRAGGGALVVKALLDETLTAEQRLRMIDLWREYDPAAPAIASLEGLRNVAVREGVVRYLLETGRPDEAGRMLSPLTGNASDGLRARVLLASGRASEAQRIATAVIAADSRQCDALVALASVDLGSSKPTDAVRTGQQAASECPSLVEAWTVTARAYQATGQAVQVERVFRDSLERNPDSFPLHSAFVAWLMRAGKSEQAPGVVRHLVRYAPLRPSTWRLLATACGTDQSCRDGAAEGQAKAMASYQIDRRPGETPQRGLLAGLAPRS